MNENEFTSLRESVELHTDFTQQITTLPVGKSKIKFLSEPYKKKHIYNYGKEKREHTMIKGILYLDEVTIGKRVNIPCIIGLPKTALQGLLICVERDKTSEALTNRIFSCENINCRKYEWTEHLILKDEMIE